MRSLICCLTASMFIQSAWAAELPSVEDLLRPAEFSEVALSPDGEHLAIIAGHDYGQRVIVLNLSERSAVAGLEQEEGVYNAEPQWLSDDRVFFVTWDDDPGSFDYMNSYSRGALLDIRRHITRNLFFPFNDIIHLLPDEDRMLVLRGEEHDRRLTQVVRMHETRMRDLPEIAAAGDLRALEFIADLDGVVRGRALEEEEWGPIHIQTRIGESEDSWITRHSLAQDFHFDLLGFGPSGATVRYIARDQRDTSALFEIDLLTNEVSVIAEAPAGLDVGAVLPVQHMPDIFGRILAIQWWGPEPGRMYLDRTASQVAAALAPAFPGERIRLLSHDAAMDQWVFQTYGPDEPGVFFLFDIRNGQVEQMFEARSWLRDFEFADRRSIQVEAEDGLTLTAHITGGDGSRGTIIALPDSLFAGQFTNNFNPIAQVYATRGYNYVQVEVRGTDGYGRTFSDAGDADYLGRARDVLTIIDELIASGEAEPGRICVKGDWRGGGIALLTAALDTEDNIACVFGYNTETDFEDTFAWLRRDWHFYGIYADEEDPDLLRNSSPINLVEQISAAVLITRSEEFHADPNRVKRLTRALRDQGTVAIFSDVPVRGGDLSSIDLPALIGQYLRFLNEHLPAEVHD